MDFFGKLNSKNSFGLFQTNNKNMIVNIICGVLLIALIVVLIICLVRKNDDFSDSHENNGTNHNENYDILMFDRDGCGFSEKMKGMVKDSNHMIGNKKVRIVDMTKEPELAKKYGVTGTPTMVCLETGKQSVGLKSLEKVSEDLKADNSNNNSNNNSSDKDILFIGSPGCTFCVKAKKLMDDLGIEYKFIDSNSPEGNEHMRNKNSNGVPLIIQPSTDTTIKGFNQAEITNLKN